MRTKKPEIIVIAGPNGSGKSTIKNFLQLTIEYVNADNIKTDMGITDIEAAEIATQRRETLVKEKKDFAFETVLSTDRNIHILNKAKENGYFIRSYFILTKNPRINIFRIESRVKKGGHDVPKDKIIKSGGRTICEIKMTKTP